MTIPIDNTDLNGSANNEGGQKTEILIEEDLDTTKSEDNTQKPDELNKLFEDDNNNFKEKARQKSLDGIINSQVDKLIESDVSEHDELLKQFPKLKDRIYQQYAERITEDIENDDKYIKLEQEINFLKSKVVENESQKSKKEFDKFLDNSGYTIDDFNKAYGETFITSVKDAMTKGQTRSTAIRTAIGEMVMNQGFVPKKAIKEAEERGKEDVGFNIPSANSGKERSKIIRLTKRQAEIAQRCGNDPTKIY